MRTVDLLAELGARRITLHPAPEGIRYQAPRGALTPELRVAVTEHRAELLAVLILARVRATWNPGDRIAYRDDGSLATAKYAGVGANREVNVWLGDGALRAIPATAVALEWPPDDAEMFEERLCTLLTAGVPEDLGRVQAAELTRSNQARLCGMGGLRSR